MNGTPSPRRGRVASGELRVARDRSRHAQLTTRNSQLATIQPLPGQQAAPLWQAPLPLAEELDAVDFPLRVLPRALLAFIHDVAAATNCPFDIVAVPLLTLAGAAIGARRALEIKDGWEEFPSLWSVVIAPPGNAKTPALNFVAAPFKKEQKKLRAAHKVNVREWELGKVKHEPTMRSIYVDDITREKAARLLEANPAGLPMIKDELMGFINSMDEYKSGAGGDREFWIQSWNVRDTRADRSKFAEPLMVDLAMIPITGGTQPDRLPMLRGLGIVDGFIDRFLPAFPEPLAPIGENWLGVSRKVRNRWAQVVQILWDLPVQEDPLRPRVLRLTDSGKKAWERFTLFIAAQQRRRDELHPVIYNTLAKLKSYGARLALIVHLLRFACREVEYEDVDGESMKRAARLVAYFYSHIKKLHGVLDSDPRLGEARRVLGCIERHRLNGFTRAELFRYLRTFFRRVEGLNRPLAVLCEYGYLWQQPPDNSARPGPRSERYLVNPLWAAPSSGTRWQQATAALAPPPFELTADGLGQAWVYYLTRTRGGNKADSAVDVARRFAELLRQGHEAIELLQAIQDERRDRSEQMFHFEDRIKSARVRPTAWSEARKAESERERQRDAANAAAALRDRAATEAAWAALPASEKERLREQARSRHPWLRDKPDDSSVLIAACWQIARGAQAEPGERNGAGPA
jgi:Protein of unknown function (DUF3987)